MPWGHTTDLNASYRFKMGGFDAILSGSVNNLFDYNYITHGQSPLTTDGTWENAEFVHLLDEAASQFLILSIVHNNEKPYS